MFPESIRNFVALLILSMMVLGGCDQEALIEKFTPKEEAAFAREVIENLIARDFTAVESAIAPAEKSNQLRKQLEAMADTVPTGPPRSVRTVGVHTISTTSHTSHDLAFEYEYPGGWVVANVVLESRYGKTVVRSLYFTLNKQSLAEMNRFSLANKSVLHYLVFSLAIAIPVFVLYALVVCVRTRSLSRKRLWLLFILFGIVQFRFNWSSGEWAIEPISLVLFSAGFSSSGPVGPVLFTLAFPLGAFLFLTQRFQRAARVSPDSSLVPPPQADHVDRSGE